MFMRNRDNGPVAFYWLGSLMGLPPGRGSERDRRGGEQPVCPRSHDLSENGAGCWLTRYYEGGRD